MQAHTRTHARAILFHKNREELISASFASVRTYAVIARVISDFVRPAGSTMHIAGRSAARQKYIAVLAHDVWSKTAPSALNQQRMERR